MAEHKFNLDPFFVDLKHKHDAVKLSVREQDSVTYYAAKAFTISEFHPKDDKQNAPYPFSRPLEPLGRNQQGWEAQEGLDGIWRVNSGPAKPEAIGCGYDAKFRHGTRKSPAPLAAEGDPDVDIGP